jgi:hypothetical protein
MFINIISNITLHAVPITLLFFLFTYNRWKKLYLQHQNEINNRFYTFYTYHNNFFTRMNRVIYPFYTELFDKENINNFLTEKSEKNKENEVPTTKIEKYEDKYLTKIRSLPEEYIFSPEEESLEAELFTQLFKQSTEDLEIKKLTLKELLANYQQELSDIENMEFTEAEKTSTYNDEEGIIESLEEQMKQKKTHYAEQAEIIKNELLEITDKVITETEIKEIVKNKLLNERLDKLQNNYIIEATPLGNVLMFYNNKKDTFQYYSDNEIPYRFLEVVGRRYVLTFNCRFLYVDMEQELKNYEKKIEEKEKEKEMEKQRQEELKTQPNALNDVTEKKSVFAKFKTYNKEAGSGRVNKAPPPKNSIPTKQQITNEKVLLKEKSNHYTREGKISNFNILKKIDRKVVNKKYAMSFADFKKYSTKK